MTPESQGPEPAGREEPETVDAGEPERARPGLRPEDEERPDLDEREQRIRTQRKPAGPPLEDGPQEVRRPAERTEPPADPAE